MNVQVCVCGPGFVYNLCIICVHGVGFMHKLDIMWIILKKNTVLWINREESSRNTRFWVEILYNLQEIDFVQGFLCISCVMMIVMFSFSLRFKQKLASCTVI